MKSRSTTELYKCSNKTSQQIGEELDVSYLIEGWATLLEDIISVDISLMEAHGGEVLWSEHFDPSYSVRNLSDLKSNIAFRVLDGVQATISTEDEERIRRAPEIGLASYDPFMQAEELLWEFRYGKKDSALLSEADKLYRKTVEQEPSFAGAYLGLAKVYWEKNFWNEILNPNFMEPFNDYVTIAFDLDDQLDELYLLKGKCFQRIGDRTTAISQYRLALCFNPNSWEAFRNNGLAHINIDHAKSLENLFKAEELNNGPEVASL